MRRSPLNLILFINILENLPYFFLIGNPKPIVSLSKRKHVFEESTWTQKCQYGQLILERLLPRMMMMQMTIVSGKHFKSKSKRKANTKMNFLSPIWTNAAQDQPELQYCKAFSIISFLIAFNPAHRRMTERLRADFQRRMIGIFRDFPSARNERHTRIIQIKYFSLPSVLFSPFFPYRIIVHVSS